MDFSYIIVEGVIGTGKTSLARKLQEQFQAQLVLETFEENPFLASFYKNPERWAFQTQMFFLVNRFKQQEELLAQNNEAGVTISDYLFEKDRIFASLTLKEQDLELYETIFPVFNKLVRMPECVIYLHSSVPRLMSNIMKRDRVMEREMPVDYIRSLADAYSDFFGQNTGYTLLKVEMDDFNFVDNHEDYLKIISALKAVSPGKRYTLSAKGLETL